MASDNTMEIDENVEEEEDNRPCKRAKFSSESDPSASMTMSDGNDEQKIFTSIVHKHFLPH